MRQSCESIFGHPEVLSFKCYGSLRPLPYVKLLGRRNQAGGESDCVVFVVKCNYFELQIAVLCHFVVLMVLVRGSLLLLITLCRGEDKQVMGVCA